MIAILDWGIGGLGFFKLLRQRHPKVSVIYWSDAGYTPYGTIPAQQLAARVRRVAGELRRLGADRLVVACNAASTILPALGVRDTAGPMTTAHGTIDVTGVIAHAVDLTTASGARTVGVIGGRRTIRSGIYRKDLEAAGLAVRQRVAQPLSAHIEAGDLDSAALHQDLSHILRPLRGVDALLLACTHYPALGDRFCAYVPGTRLLDPAHQILRWVTRNWVTGQRLERGPDQFISTGNVRVMRKAAARAFDVSLPVIQHRGGPTNSA